MTPLEMLTNQAWAETAGAVVLYLLLLLFVAVVVAIPLFFGLLVRYTVRRIRRNFESWREHRC